MLCFASLCIIGSIFTVNGWKNADWWSLYRESEELLQNARVHTEQNCLYIYDGAVQIAGSFFEVRNYKSITCISKDNIDSILDFENLFDDAFMLTVDGDPDKVIAFVKSNFSNFDSYDRIGGHDGTHTYYIHCEEENELIEKN